MPASAEKQPAWQMCKPPVRGSGGDLAHAPGYAGHVRTCHVQLWWQRPAAALTERRMRHQLAVACHPPALAPDDGTRRNDSPGTGCNNSVVDPALCLHYWHAVKAGRPWLTGGLSWPVMESTRAPARGTRAPRSAPGMAQPQTPSGCGSRQDRPVACLSSCDEALLPATRWRCPEERPTPATPCRWFRRKLCGELFVFCLNKIPLETTLFRLW